MTGTLGMSSETNTTSAQRQVLTFQLESEVFGVDIMRVREIRGWSAVTAVPETPPHVLGVLNLRGVIVPVIDLRTRLSLPTIEHTATTVIIVITVVGAAGKRDFGLVVDAVSDVTDLPANAIKATPSGLGQLNRNCVPELATVGDRMLLLLDIDDMLADSMELALAS